MASPRSNTTPRLFWIHLGGVQLLFALFMLAGGARLAPAQWPDAFSLVGVVTLVDVIAGPALVFAWLERRRPKVALPGAAAVAVAGLWSARTWLGGEAFAAALHALPPVETLAIAVALLACLAYELRVMVLLADAWRSANPDVAIARLTAPGPRDTALERAVKRGQAIELRFWAYATRRRPPAVDAFAGTHHFAYARQSGNAATWIGWAVVNALPTPILHLLLHQASPALAVVTTVATLLGSLWCLAEARAAHHRPVSLDARSLYLRYGLVVDRTIARELVASARALDWKDRDAREVTHHAGCGGANVRLELRTGEVIHLGLDEPGRFLAALAPAL
jgi:hypothetical protein